MRFQHDRSLPHSLFALLETICLPGGYGQLVLAAYDAWQTPPPRADSLAEARRILDTDAAYKSQPHTLMLLLHTAAEERHHGVWQRYPEDVWLATMKEFPKFIDFYRIATGEYGYGKGTWPLLHASAKFLHIGELEYEPTVEDGQREVHLHIPAGSHLDPAAVADSLQRVDAFLREYLPEWADAPRCCESWMLAPEIVSLLPQDSHIRWFASLFDIVKVLPEEQWYLEFVFKLEYFQWAKGIDLNALRECTRLQRALKQHLLRGGRPGTAKGYLRQDAFHGESIGPAIPFVRDCRAF